MCELNSSLHRTTFYESSPAGGWTTVLICPPSKNEKLRDQNPLLSACDVMLDVIFYLEALPPPGGDVRAQDAVISPGGASVNFTVAVSRLGLPSAIVGKVSGDPAGKRILDFLRREGVDITGLLVSPSCQAKGVVASLVDGAGERTMVSHLPRGCMVVKSDVPWGLVRRAQIFHFAGYSLLPDDQSEAVLGMATEVGSAGGVVMFDPSPVVSTIPEPTLSEALDASDLVLPSLSEVGALRRLGLWESASEKAVVKLGDKGCRLPTGEVVPAFRVRVTDSTGAGDAFAAGLAVGLAREMSLREACELANVVAGLKVEKRGSGVAMPTWDEVEAKLNSLR